MILAIAEGLLNDFRRIVGVFLEGVFKWVLKGINWLRVVDIISLFPMPS